MTEENLIKSADRVKDHGEVFTPRSIVNLMLDQPEITAKINDLKATFLEPSAGEGAFLVELLNRKMKVALQQSKNARQYGVTCLIALSSLYGIELLEDNVETLVMNMNDVFRDNYRETTREKFNSEPNSKILKSAKVIIRANMAQGDALKKVTSDGQPIILSEWKSISGKNDLVQRTEYTFDAIIDGSGPTNSVKGAAEQLDLFDDFDDQSDVNNEKHYLSCKWEDVYKELVS